MYPRNAASPPRISIGAVVQISDGAVQGSGCTVRILPEGGSEADGGGTTAYSTDGVVLYTPTQAETNYTAFVLVAKKTGCIPATVTVVTTASSTAGTAKPADGSIVTATFGACVLPETTKTGSLTFTNAAKVDAAVLTVNDFATAVAQKLAAIILRRTMAAIEADSNGDTLVLGSLYGLVQQAQESNTTAHAGKLTAFKTDGTTELGQKNLATAANAEPVTGIS